MLKTLARQIPQIGRLVRSRDDLARHVEQLAHENQSLRRKMLALGGEPEHLRRTCDERMADESGLLRTQETSVLADSAPRAAVFAHEANLLEAAERKSQDAGIDGALNELRRLSLDEFGQVLLDMPNPQFPGLSRVLPSMASDEVQRRWTGACGRKLLGQSISFVRATALRFHSFTGRSLDDCKMLDFGCGYGRLIRLMYYFTNPDNIWGVDPWEVSIGFCRAAGMPGKFAISECLPEELPVDDARFDFIYAFSVFTHLAERATTVALATLARYIKPDGVLAITIRPKEYWSVAPGCDIRRMNKIHDKNGFAFVPHPSFAGHDDARYGDTSMTLAWLSSHIPAWRVVAHDRSLCDPQQLVVYLRAR